MTDRHPKTDARYIYVFPMAPAFAELHASYQALSKGRPWLEVLLPAEAERAMLEWDERTLFVFFHRPSKAVMRAPRKAKVSFVYTEPVGPVEAMTSDAIAYRNAFCEIASGLDCALAHTPAMVEQVGAVGNVSTWLLPAGLDPRVLGKPDWECPKKRDFFFYGAPVAKREWSLREMKKLMGDRLGGSSNCYGMRLNDELNASCASIYVAHSDVTSFSTWRIWQTLASSAALIAEGNEKSEVDAWPLVAGYDYFALPRFTKENLPAIVETLLGMQPEFWRSFAARASFKAEHFTAEKCVDNYLVPLSQAQFGWG